MFVVRLHRFLNQNRTDVILNYGFQKKYVTSEVLVARKVYVVVPYVMTPCRLIIGYSGHGCSYCLHVQSTSEEIIS